VVYGVEGVYAHNSVYVHQVSPAPDVDLERFALASTGALCARKECVVEPQPVGAAPLAVLLAQLGMKPEQLAARINELRARRGLSPLHLKSQGREVKDLAVGVERGGQQARV